MQIDFFIMETVEVTDLNCTATHCCKHFILCLKIGHIIMQRVITVCRPISFSNVRRHLYWLHGSS